MEPAHLMLSRGGAEVPLTPKVVETLLALAERPGEIVSKEELIERLWENSFVEESNLIQNIYVLRKALGPLPDGRPMIETLRRRGYRLNADVRVKKQEKIDPAGDETKIAAEKSDAAIIAPVIVANKAKKRRYRWTAVLAGGALVLLAWFIRFEILGLQHRARAGSNPPAGLVFKRLTPDLDARTPIISPDGRYLAYAVIDHGKDSLWLKDIATGATVQLLPPIDHAEGYTALNFSSDATALYYSTHRPNTLNATIFRLTITGGAQQLIAGDDISPSALSPDGRQLAFINSKYELMLINSDGSGETRVLGRPEEKAHFVAWSSQMAWSADGQHILLCGGRLVGDKSYEGLVEISVADGSSRIVPTPPELSQIDDVAYLGDSGELLVTARRNPAEPFQLWRIAPDGQSAARVTLDNHDYSWFSLSADGRQLVAEQGLGHFNLWNFSLSDPKDLKQLTFGNVALDGYEGLVYLPDGRIVYSSTRSGNVDLWVMNPDGSSQKQLTAGAGPWNARPRTTPDGRYIVFASMRSGATELWRIEADGANAKQLTDSAGQVFRSSVSYDGKWVYYNTENDGTLWKVSIEGGTPFLVSSEKVLFPAVSPDGKLIAGTELKSGASNLWNVVLLSAETGERLKTLDIQASRRTLIWTRDSKNLIASGYDRTSIWLHPLDGTAPRKLGDFPNEEIQFFAISPDYKQIAFSGGRSFSEAVEIDGFNPEDSN